MTTATHFRLWPPDATLEHHSCHGIDVAGQDRTAPRRSGTTSGFTIADRSAGARSSPPAHRGARVIRTDASRFMLISQEPRGGQERKQDSEDDPDINAHLSSPAAALPTNSSLTDGIYFEDLVAQAPERKPVPSSPRHCRDVAHAQTGLAQTRRFLFLFQPAAPPTALSAAFPASVISYSMFCMLGDCDERFM